MVAHVLAVATGGATADSETIGPIGGAGTSGVRSTTGAGARLAQPARSAIDMTMAKVPQDFIAKVIMRATVGMR